MNSHEPTESIRNAMAEILAANTGFENPALWIPYALEHDFTRIEPQRVNRCPDCSEEQSQEIGQYAYYSTLIRLKRCKRCQLIFSDVLLSPEVIAKHFERAYKDETYFRVARQAIFESVSDHVCRRTPEGGSVLDVGGARGHLLEQIQKKRPDLHLTLNDLSEAACSDVRERLGIPAHQGGVHSLQALEQRFDTIILCDVIYYEPDIRGLWSVVADRLNPGGMVHIRLPNRLQLIRALQALRQVTGRRGPLDSSVPSFNPEHIFILSSAYLRPRLRALGFQKIEARPSPPLAPEGGLGWRRPFLAAARATSLATAGRILLTPAVEWIASDYKPTSGS